MDESSSETLLRVFKVCTTYGMSFSILKKYIFLPGRYKNIIFSICCFLQEKVIIKLVFEEFLIRHLFLFAEFKTNFLRHW